MLSANQTTVMILAAGHGNRMLPLTANTPKPLLKVGRHSLIEHHLLRLASQGFKNIVINHAYLGAQIVSAIGNGEKFGLSITYSDESSSGALETAGGIIKALPLIQSDPFLVINGDIYTDIDYSSVLIEFLPLARLVLVDNPEHNLEGDFILTDTKSANLSSKVDKKFTFSGIGLYKKALFNKLEQGSRPLAPLLYRAETDQLLETCYFGGTWHDIGTPERLANINSELSKTLVE